MKAFVIVNGIALIVKIVRRSPPYRFISVKVVHQTSSLIPTKVDNFIGLAKECIFYLYQYYIKKMVLRHDRRRTKEILFINKCLTCSIVAVTGELNAL